MLPPSPTDETGSPRRAPLRVGIVCPYSFDSPGGVQAHIHDLAQALIALGHDVRVLAPAEAETDLPSFVDSVGSAVAVPYNGSVARVAFGPLTLARVRRWLKNNRFDVLHVHEPTAPSVGLLACIAAQGPIVATFHMASDRSRAMAMAHAALQPFLEKITGRIAVSALARKFQVEHLDGGGVEIPNGVAVDVFARAQPLPGWPGDGEVLGFLGRFTEDRKGFPVLLDAFARLVPHRPRLRLLVAGPGDVESVTSGLEPAVRERITFLGKVSDVDKARMLRSVHLYVAPNIGGESFGIILTEAMAAGTPVVASDLDAFCRVLDDGRAGAVFPTGDAGALAERLNSLLDDPAGRQELARRASDVVAQFDWAVVARRVLEVYTSAIAATPAEVTEDTGSPGELPAGLPAPAERPNSARTWGTRWPRG